MRRKVKIAVRRGGRGRGAGVTRQRVAQWRRDAAAA
jgi:hypothetical protein